MHLLPPCIRPRLTVVLFALLTGCASSSPEPTEPTGAAWPEADRLFREDARFRGGDSAYTVDLGDARVLWLFGDSFVGTAADRSGSKLVRNAVAVQQGLDPTAAGLEFFFGGSDDEPAAFFRHATNDDIWLWPGPGVRLDGGLLLTFMQLEASDEGLGFQTVGSEARFIENPADPPPQWLARPIELPAAPAGVQLGAGAMLVHDDHLYAYAPVEPGSHDIYLARWPLTDAGAGDLSAPDWWNGQAFAPGADDARRIVSNLQTELSVQATDDGLVMISVDGFGGTNIVRRDAPAPQGPWSASRRVLRPEESDRDDVLVYSAKSHPALDGSGELVITYCSNHLDFWTLIDDMSLYFPRFVRATP